jgi:hypothetical protein
MGDLGKARATTQEIFISSRESRDSRRSGQTPESRQQEQIDHQPSTMAIYLPPTQKCLMDKRESIV